MKKYYREALFIFWIILFLPSILFSQTENKEIQWTRIESPNGEVLFSIPSNFLTDNEDNKYHVFTVLNGVRMNVEINKNKKAKESIYLMRQYRRKTDIKISQFTLGEFIGDVYVAETKDSYSMTFYIASSKEFYSVTASAKTSKDATFEKFLQSFKLGDRYLIKQEAPLTQTEENKISITSLKTSPIVLEALQKKDAEKTKIKYDLEKKKTSIIKETYNNETKYSRSLTILRKPRTRFTDAARQNGTQGIIQLRVQFLANGEIGDIVVLASLKNGLDREAVDAARKIKFLPAEIDGKPVDITKTIEYSFAIY